MSHNTPGISGFASYLPPYRVQLSDWCDWNEQPWEKVRTVVGESFRMRGPRHNVYTLAANAALRLIDAYEIDPAEIGFLALATESSTDNSAGAVIVKGMLDDALRTRGTVPINRACEVPEYKHACLGGVYALKGALRYVGLDGAGRKAIVIAADIAEYALGSSGEPTQGAGAVAMLVETQPRLLAVDLAGAGNAADYRVLDFRKPLARFIDQRARGDGQIQDLPVFNGHYSTTCYVDAVRHAIAALLERNQAGAEWLRAQDAVFMHRPYQRMPETGWSLAYLYALAADDHPALIAVAEAAGVAPAALRDELTDTPDIAALAHEGRMDEDGYPLAMQAVRAFRKMEDSRDVLGRQMRLGVDRMRDLGNLYTAALPGWLAAGLEEACRAGGEHAGERWLAIGYGSGDAAEAVPMRIVEGWRDAASKIDFDAALAGAVDLDKQTYEALHRGEVGTAPPAAEFEDEFVVDSIEASGIERYRYLAPARAEPRPARVG